MRLDEWQKYLDSQFLDDTLEAPPAPEARLPKPPAPREHQAVRPLEEPPAPVLPETTDPGVVPDDVPVFRAPAPQARASEPISPPIRTDDLQDLPMFLTALPAAEDRPRFVQASPEPEEERPQFAAPETETVDTPAFVIPESVRAAADSAEDVPLFRLPKANADVPQIQPQDRTSRPAADPPKTAPAPALFAPLPDMDADILIFESYLPIPRLEAETEQPAPEETPAPAERSPKRRARHARNVRPENVPSGLSAADLWAKVPKHVQTLLALERMDEQEIAQFSYKRPFAEKRHELIERLLDPILSLEDAARLLNVCPTTVRRYTNKGILTYYRKEPEHTSQRSAGQNKETRQRRFRLSDILAFLETQQTAIETDRAAERSVPRVRPVAPDAGITLKPADANASDAKPDDLSAA